jgi:hypothetical protein
MSDCKPCATLVYTQAMVSCDMGASVSDSTAYRSLVGALQYLTFTRPVISYTVQQVCLHMADPREPHLTIVKCILHYLQGSLNHSLLCCASTSDVVVYASTNWAGFLDTRRSTSFYTVFLGNDLVS